MDLAVVAHRVLKVANEFKKCKKNGADAGLYVMTNGDNTQGDVPGWGNALEQITDMVSQSKLLCAEGQSLGDRIVVYGKDDDKPSYYNEVDHDGKLLVYTPDEAHFYLYKQEGNPDYNSLTNTQTWVDISSWIEG